LEGPDGSGKTINARVLAKHLEDRGVEVVLTREPGGSPFAERIREMVLQGTGTEEKLHDLTELLLFGAARAQHLAEKIVPALEAGKVVICDRFSISTRAYQGYGRGLLHEAMLMEKLIHPNIYPDYVLSFDLPFEVSLARGKARNQSTNYSDRFEDAEIEFKTNLFNGYVLECATIEMQDPHGIIRINAEQTLEEIGRYLLSVATRIIQIHNLDAA
jgi:dTMP kinase